MLDNVNKFITFVENETIMKELKVDRTKLITQSEYAKVKGYTRQRINQMVKNNEVKVITIKGAKLIYMD